MNRLAGIVALSCLGAAFTVWASAADFKLIRTNSAGEFIVFKGEAMGPDNRGVIIRDSVAGTNSPRTAWTNFSQEALKELAKNPKMKSYAELLIEEPEQDLDTSLMPTVQKRARPQVKLAKVEVPERYAKARPGFLGSIFTSSIGWFTLFVLYAGNLYAAFEIAVYRRRPVKPVVGLAAVAPVVGPVIFLCMPEVPRPKSAAPPPVATEEESVSAPGPKGLHKGPGGAAHGALADIATMVPAAAPAPKTQYFKRGEVSFNRRFMESKLAPFFKMVLAEKEKDLFLVFNTVRGQYISQHVTKVGQADITVQVEVETATCDETFPFNDITEIQIRHRDATD